ncbi:serine/threonine-protein kinase psk1 [Xylariaceae sp. FL0594]|nr:serine/threonine-protein kinase psk1 [Xylariaceae sp. FL0594]
MLLSPAAPALTTVRGFGPSSAVSADDEANGCVTPPHPARRDRSQRIDDVVSANCSPLMRGVPSPAMSGIAMLRAQFEPLSLNGSRASSMTRTRSNSQPRYTSSTASLTDLSDGTATPSETGSVSYEVPLEHDFVSESVREEPRCDATEDEHAPRKMQADDFEPLRCLGKGTYGTVLLVKQRTTGRLYAQKQFKKASVVVHKQLVEQTKTERQILESINRHPFVVNLYYAFQDCEKLYLILEYGQGGELFTHLNTEKMFSESTAAFYMAEMVLALSYLHDSLGVVYRDLKPENCLLDAQGHLLLTDFGLSKVAVGDDDSCKSILGTVDYMAPEVILGQKYGKAVDWWSFGAMGYDLMTGSPPFRGANTAKIQQNIVKQKAVMPYFLSLEAKDLLARLLRKDPAKRLGSRMPKDLATIKSHRFFRKIDWKKLEAREMEPPIQPMITDPELAENFATEFTELSLSPLTTTQDPWNESAPWGSFKEDPFGGFSYVAPSSLLDSRGYMTAKV